MPKINSGFDLTNLVDSEKFFNYCAQVVDNIINVINGKLEFDSNIATQTLSVKFPVSAQDLQITHKLNKKNVNFEIVNKTVVCDVYHGTGSDTVSTIVLRCNQATTVTVRLS